MLRMSTLFLRTLRDDPAVINDRDPVRNGVFTRVLLKEMETPGLPVGDVLRNVLHQWLKFTPNEYRCRVCPFTE